jgi:hypothetical protein
MPMLLICLILCPVLLSIPNISEIPFIICFALIAAAILTYARTIIIDEETKTILSLRGVLGLKKKTTRSFSDLASIKVETVYETVRGSRLTKLIEVHILVLHFKDGKKNRIEKSSDLEYVDSLTGAIERLCNLTRE